VSIKVKERQKRLYMSVRCPVKNPITWYRNFPKIVPSEIRDTPDWPEILDGLCWLGKNEWPWKKWQLLTNQTSNRVESPFFGPWWWAEKKERKKEND
jgi:hypothetical protein